MGNFGTDFWSFSGPRDFLVGAGTAASGRVNAIAVDPTNPMVMFVGAAGGGVWKTTDGGRTWWPLSNDWKFEAISSLAIDPRSPSTLYVGTGDFAAWSQQSFGLMKSTDGGVSFTNLAVAEVGGYSISAIVVDSDDPNVVTMTAGRGRLFFGQVWRSVDGGRSWTAVVTEPAEWADLAIGLPNGSQRLYYAVGWNASGGVMYRSVDRGATWSKLTVPWGPGQFGISVATSTQDPSGVYVLAGADRKVLWSSSAGAANTWREVGTLPQTEWGQLDYDRYLRCTSYGPYDYLILGLVHIFGWSAATPTWSVLPSGHDDQHCLVVDPTNPLRVLIGNDGGVYSMTVNPGNPQSSTATSLNAGLGVTQIYKAAFVPLNPQIMLAATQDNALGLANGDLGHWSQPQAPVGDGVAAVILPTNPNVQYAARGVFVYGIYRTTDAWSTWTDFTPPHQGDVINPFSTILVGDIQGNGVYWGTDYLYFWNEASQEWSAHLGGQRLVGTPDGSVRAIGIAPSDFERVCTGASDGQVWAGQGPNWTWTRIDSRQLPSRSVNAISIHPTNPSDVIVAFDGTGTGHVWRCADVTSSPRSWTNIDGGGSGVLPDVPVNAIARGPLDPANRLFVATQVGVFGTEDGGQTWLDLTIPNGLPRVPVMDLAISANQLHAATFGRGIWTGRLEFTKFNAAAASSGNSSVVVASSADGLIFCNSWQLGSFGPWRQVAGTWRADAAPAAALVGPDHNYLFVVIKGLDGNLYLNQGQLGGPFTGWGSMSFQSNVAAGAASSGNNAVVVATGTDGRIYYSWWPLGSSGPFQELPGGWQTNVAPAAALVGQDHNYLFVIIKGLDGNLYLNQGQLGGPFAGWGSMSFQSNVAAGAASSGNNAVVVATGTDGRIYYSWWPLGSSGPFQELPGGWQTDVAPAAALVGQDHNYLFVIIKGLDGNLYLNQGQLGGPFTGWGSMT